jgi:fructose-bisphosphate aldolase class II
LSAILADCRRDRWAVPAFDVINMETVRAVFDGSAAERAPVILMVYPNHTPQDQWPGLVAFARAEIDRTGVPASFHLDHGSRLEQVHAAIEAGFSSVMIDASRLPLDENIARTREVVELAHSAALSVEAELGHVGMGEEELSDEEWTGRLTRPEDAARFVKETGVDALAVAIGTVHGLYRGVPRLDFERLYALEAAVSVPLVLHGGSGTPDRDVQRAVQHGICKVNIWTEVAIAFTATLQQELSPPPTECRLPDALAKAEETARHIVRQKILLLGANGKAA